jgi:hypothetical protein
MGAAEVRTPLPPNVAGDAMRALAAVTLFEPGRVSFGQVAVPATNRSVRSSRCSRDTTYL